MISATEFRELQTKAIADKIANKADHKAKREAQQLAKFTEACEIYRNVILDEVQDSLKYVREKGLRYKYIMLDHTNLILPVHGYAYTTMLYGFWDKEKQTFDDSVFTKSGVPKPFDLAVEEVAKFGYTLENVSDPARSKRLYIKLSWEDGDKEESSGDSVVC